jgi:hypothetical protein
MINIDFLLQDNGFFSYVRKDNTLTFTGGPLLMTDVYAVSELFNRYAIMHEVFDNGTIILK